MSLYVKAAICISGQPRNVVKGFENFILPNLLMMTNDVDVFIHTWWDSEQVGKQFVNAGEHVASVPVEEDTIDTIVRLYNPVAMHFEPQRDFDEKNYAERAYPAIKPFASLSQKYSAQRAHQLRRDSGRRYDAVIRLRFDYALQTPIILENYDLSAVNVPNRCPHAGGIDDTFAIGNEENMDVYGDLFDYIDDLYESGVAFCDEILLGQHLARNNVPVKLHDITYDLIRG